MGIESGSFNPNAEARKRPGGAEPEWKEWKVGPLLEDGVESGVGAPDGNFYRFEHGEQISMDSQEDGSRKPNIILENGAKISFRQWREEVHDADQRKKTV